MTPEISLGTAQFGIDYGITNQVGKISSFSLAEINRLFITHNLKRLDTAQSYGDSEILIGQTFEFREHLKVSTKISLDIDFTKQSDLNNYIHHSVCASLERLRVDSLETLYFHRVEDLFTNNNRLDPLEVLDELKILGKIKNIGVSIYSEDDLLQIPLDRIDAIQLPFSIYDQRLKENGILQI